MPINTSMNRWNRITINIDNESFSSSSPFDSFNKQSVERSHLEEKSQDTEKSHKSTSQSTSRACR